MRLEPVLLGALSLAIATTVDAAQFDVVDDAESRWREKERRRTKMSMKGKSSKKAGSKSSKKKGSNYFDDEWYYDPGSSPSTPTFPTQPTPAKGGKGGKSQGHKKHKDAEGHYYGPRLMQSKGKGKGTPRPPRPPNPQPTRAPVEGPPNTPPPSMPPAMDGCLSAVAEEISDDVPQSITRNPPRCCFGTPPTAVFVTHAARDDSTPSGFEPFWDAVYAQILETTTALDICFVMTGYDAAAGTDELSLVLLNVIGIASTLQDVPSMMTTDPTQDVALMQAIRNVASNSLLASIGIFNSGFNNIVVESIISGQDRLPFVGYQSDAEFGTEAGQVSLRLLDGTPASPLCFNARVGVVESIAERCASFYAEVTSTQISPAGGISCSADSSPAVVASQITQTGSNVVWSHVDCCSVVLEAAELVRAQGQSVLVGCQDLDTTGGQIDFVTQQPIELQAYQAAVWAGFPVLQAQQGLEGRREQFFPSLQSLVNTGIFSDILQLM
jgi:hypothetical protein